MDDTEPQPSPPFPFLKLPAELRLEIYKYLLPCNDTIIFHLLPGRERLRNHSREERHAHMESAIEVIRLTRFINAVNFHEWRGIYSSLFAVNKQVAEEAAHILYESNTFHFIIRLDLPSVYLDARLRARRALAERSKAKQPESFPRLIWNLSPAFGQMANKVVIVVNKTCWNDRRLYTAAKDWLRMLVDATSGRERRPMELLHVNIVEDDAETSRWWSRYQNGVYKSARPRDYTPYLLEPLVGLGPVAYVKVEGLAMENGFVEFGKKLQKVIKDGTAENLTELKFCDVMYLRAAAGVNRRRRRVARSKKNYYDPKYDWGEIEDAEEGED